jgi:nicotinamide phosphoribosyltransferase
MGKRNNKQLTNNSIEEKHMNTKNLILLTDSYKQSHSKIYADGTTYMQSYFESRSDESQEIVFFGLQYFLKEYLEGVRITEADVEEAREFAKAHFGRDDVFDYEGWLYIARDLGGKLPIRVYALPEGTVTSARKPLIVVESTDEKVFWVVNYLETLLSQIWYPTTVTTYSRGIKKTISKYLKQTSDLEGDAFNGVLNFRLHDFGFRGVSSFETSGLGGMAHLVNFLGTDTLSAILFSNKYYKSGVNAYSIPASEHSTMTSHGGRDGEVLAMERMLNQYPNGLIACVSDSYDIMNAITNIWGGVLKDKVMGRDGTLVIRPDSGDPIQTTLNVFNGLWDAFGGSINSKGYRVLDSHVRMIQGDGIDAEMVEKILYNFKLNKISAENIAFGSGGGLLQKHNRDTFKFAFKCNRVIIDGADVDVRKSPMEFNEKGEYVQSFKYSKGGDLLNGDDGFIPVFENGVVLNETTFDEVRNRASL